MNKLRKAAVEVSLAFILFSGFYGLSKFNKDFKVKADETSQKPQGNEQTQEVQPDNYPMGYFEEDNAASSSDSGASTSSSSDSEDEARSGSETRIRAFVATPAPSDLSSDDNTLPSKDAIDVSSYQSWMTQADFNKVKAAGVKTVVIKLTQGTDYTNPYAKQQIAYAKAAGLNIAVYHFADFANAQTQSAANAAASAEANYFVSVANSLGLSTNTVMILDAENPGVNYNVVDWTAASLIFSNKVKGLGYSNAKYYTSQSWAKDGWIMEPSKLGAKNMWIAQYLFGKPSASNLQNTQFGAWQYTSQMYYVGASSHSPIDTSVDYSSFFKSSVPTPSPAPAGYNNVYRMYNPNNGEHLYTGSSYEMQVNYENGWRYEGIGWYAPKSGIPVYRIYNPNVHGGDHYYTKSLYEAKQRVAEGWKWDNNGSPVFYSGGSTPVYVAYNPNASSGAHNYTTSKFEQDNLLKSGWKFGSVAWYGK